MKLKIEFAFLKMSVNLFHSLMQSRKKVLLNDIVLEGKAVSKLFLADQVDY